MTQRAFFADSDIPSDQDVLEHGLFTKDSEEGRELIALARAGDSQARERLILSFFRFCNFLASRYAYTYAWASPRIECQDLVQYGMLLVMERVDRALATDHPIPYLIRLLRNEIADYCFSFSSLIKTPEHNRINHPDATIPVASLETPITESPRDGAQLTLADSLPAPALTLEHAPEQDDPDYRHLYEAVKHLSPRQCETITRHYGLGCDPESLNIISQSFPKHGKTRSIGAYLAKKAALQKLRKCLEEAEVYVYA